MVGGFHHHVVAATWSGGWRSEGAPGRSQGTSAGADRTGDDLLPGDQAGLNQTQWSLFFLNGGTYKLCYRPYGFDWKELSPLFQVAGVAPDAGCNGVLSPV